MVEGCLNFYGPSKAAIIQIDKTYRPVAEDLLKFALIQNSRTILEENWVNFKSPDYKNVKYSLVHNIGGIGYGAYRNESDKKVEIRFNIDGENIQKCK